MLSLFISLLLLVPQNPEVLSPFLVEHARAETIDTSTTTLQAYARSVAKENKLNVKKFLAVIECESGWDANAKGDYPDGKGNFVTKAKAPLGSEPTSFGLCQLHNPSRDWGISTSTALNPYSCMEIMANAWVKRNERKWTCAR